MLFRSFAISAILGFGLLGSTLADDSPKQPQAAGQQSAPAPAGEAAPGSPTATAESASKGALKNPYPDFAVKASRNTWLPAAMAATAVAGVAAWARP